MKLGNQKRTIKTKEKTSSPHPSQILHEFSLKHKKVHPHLHNDNNPLSTHKIPLTTIIISLFPKPLLLYKQFWTFEHEVHQQESHSEECLLAWWDVQRKCKCGIHCYFYKSWCTTKLLMYFCHSYIVSTTYNKMHSSC